jgi:hypothetical protein
MRRVVLRMDLGEPDGVNVAAELAGSTNERNRMDQLRFARDRVVPRAGPVCPGGDCPPGTAGLMPRRANLPAERLALPPSKQVLVQDGPGRRMRLGRDFYRIINVFG